MTTNGNTATAARFRSFEAAVQEGEPIGFELGGEPFDCLPIAPAGAMASAYGLGRMAYLVRCIEWLESVLVDDDQVARFRKVINSKDPVVPEQTIGDLVSWLTEQYTGRPTQPPTA